MFTCSIKFDNGRVKYHNFHATDEVDACWIGKAYADDNNATLLNVRHSRRV